MEAQPIECARPGRKSGPGSTRGAVAPIEQFGSRAHHLVVLAAEGLPIRAGEVVTVDAVTELGTDGSSLAADAPPPLTTSATTTLVGDIWRRIAHRGLTPVDVWLSPTDDDSGQVLATAVTSWSDYLLAFRTAVALSASVGAHSIVVQQHVSAIAEGAALREFHGHGAIAVDCSASLPGHRGDQLRLSPYGRLIQPCGTSVLDRFQRHRLVRIVRRAERAIGSPVLLDWTLDRCGYLWVTRVTPVRSAERARPPSDVVIDLTMPAGTAVGGRAAAAAG